MKKIFYIFIAIMLCGGFVGCGDDAGEKVSVLPDEPKDEPKDEPNSNYVLVSVTEKSRQPSGYTMTSTIFKSPVYEVDSWSGKTVLKSYEWSSAYTHSYVYDLPNYVYHYSDSPYEEICTLANGLISELKIGRESQTFRYDKKHRLIETVNKYGTIEGPVSEFSYDDKYNMVGYKSTSNNELVDDIQIEYSTIPAKTIPLQCFDISACQPFCVFFNQWPFLEMGLFGNSIPLYLVDKIKCLNDEVEKVYEYKLDENGYVIEMTQKDYRVDGTYLTTYNFEWKEVSTPTYTNWLFSDIGSPYYKYLDGSGNSSDNNEPEDEEAKKLIGTWVGYDGTPGYESTDKYTLTFYSSGKATEVCSYSGGSETMTGTYKYSNGKITEWEMEDGSILMGTLGECPWIVTFITSTEITIGKNNFSITFTKQ